MYHLCRLISPISHGIYVIIHVSVYMYMYMYNHIYLYILPAIPHDSGGTPACSSPLLVLELVLPREESETGVSTNRRGIERRTSKQGEVGLF